MKKNKRRIFEEKKQSEGYPMQNLNESRLTNMLD